MFAGGLNASNIPGCARLAFEISQQCSANDKDRGKASARQPYTWRVYRLTAHPAQAVWRIVTRHRKQPVTAEACAANMQERARDGLPSIISHARMRGCKPSATAPRARLADSDVAPVPTGNVSSGDNVADHSAQIGGTSLLHRGTWVQQLHVISLRFAPWLS